MVYPVVQETPPNSIPPTSCALDRVVKCAGVWLSISHDLAVLHYQFRVMLTGSPESIFQPQARVAGFHNYGYLRHSRQVPAFLNRSLDGNGYGDLLAIRLV